MPNILIIDDQKWVIDLCREVLAGEGHKVVAMDYTASVRKNIFSFKADLVLLNLYLKHGFVVWDVLRDIKIQDPDLLVLIFTAHDKYLSDSRLSGRLRRKFKETLLPGFPNPLGHLGRKYATFVKNS